MSYPQERSLRARTIVLCSKSPVLFATSYLSLGRSLVICLMTVDGVSPQLICAQPPLRAVQSSIDLPTCAAGLYSSMQCQLIPLLLYELTMYLK